MTATGTRIGWLDCSVGVSGDMLLGALADAGAWPAVADAAAALAPLGVSVSREQVRRGALRATAVTVDPGTAPRPRRTLADVLDVLAGTSLDEAVRARAEAVFGRLARAEAAVHGIGVDDVHFHEVGALDAIVDVVCVCAGVAALGVSRLLVGPVGLGGGTAATDHGVVPVPGPAVLALLAGTGIVAVGGPVDVELATPTGVALLAELAVPAPAPAMPPLAVEATGVGAGGRDLAHPNVVRLVVGTAADHTGAAGAVAAGDGGEPWLVLEANVDDADPRLWPGVLDALLAAGAADAWLTPILMKKGRPAHTVAALVPATAVDLVRDELFRQTSTIGVRATPVGKTALDRDWVTVHVGGRPVRVKRARLHGEIVNVSPEWADVAAVAAALGRPAKAVLAAAVAAAHEAGCAGAESRPEGPPR